MKSAVAALLFLSTVNADLYLQAVRGSNNRLDERGRERANANRLFDSQNNNRGGYNVGHLTYYTGEKVPISWTNQHGAGTYQLKESEIVLQYTCDPLMRDGTTTNRIPDNPTDCQDYNCDTDVEYGRHESWESYQYCKATSRNKGLFTANQNLNNRNAATYTRQDSKGTRYGYECPEERDYYPYWRGSMWRDMAIYTNTVDRCAAYQSESQNVKARYECRYTEKYWDDVLYGYVQQSSGELPLNEYECTNSDSIWYTNPNTNSSLPKWEWIEINAFGIDAPECKESRTTRANHHGTPGDRTYWTHYWEVPETVLDLEGHDQCCVIRARYNITTDEYAAWAADDSVQAGLDFKNNSNITNPNPDDDPAWVRIWEKFDLEYEDIAESFLDNNGNPGNPDADNANQKLSRGYVFRNDPEVDPFGYEPFGGSDSPSRILLQLAINTDQFGRTFQDRTHCFSVKDRADAGIEDNNDITLVTVQGKRGNIVQVYPATEYFFIPEPAVLYQDSYVHFCWTGSNRNPNNNDGQGLEGSDRSNICPLTQTQFNKLGGGDEGNYGDVDGQLTQRNAGAVGDPGNAYPDWLRSPSYGMPVYYNYAPKRDLPRKAHSATGGSSASAQSEFDLGEYPYNDPYNEFWFSERGAVSQMAGLSEEVLGALCTTRRVDSLMGDGLGLMDYGNMEELDDAGTTFCIEPLKVSSTEDGLWNFLCTRNNNFSNRSQKGSLAVSNAYTDWVSATQLGYFGSANAGQAKIVILPNSVSEGDSLDFSVTTWLNRGETSSIVQLSGSDGGAFAADALNDDNWIEVWIPYTGKSLSYPKAWYRETPDDEWTEHSDASVEFEEATSFGVVQVDKGGYYTLSNEPDILAYAAVVLGVLLFMTAMFFVVKRNCMKGGDAGSAKN